MAKKIARLSTATITFYPEDSTEGIVLGNQQSVSLSRNAEKKELLSNDNSIDESVLEIETKVDYTFKTEIADLSLENLSLCFKGLIEEKTYKAGDKFINGKVLKDKTAALEIGDSVIDTDKIYVVTEAMPANSFNKAKCSKKVYNAKVRKLRPQVRHNNYGTVICDGVNIATGQPQILNIPHINLGFNGDFTVSGNDWAKVSLEGKVLKKDGEEIFELIDA